MNHVELNTVTYLLLQFCDTISFVIGFVIYNQF